MSATRHPRKEKLESESKFRKLDSDSNSSNLRKFDSDPKLRTGPSP